MAAIKQGQILKYLIKEHGYKVEDFAAMMGYKARETLTRQFRHERLREDVIMKAATLLGVSQSDIAGGNIVTKVNGLQKPGEVEQLRAELEEARKTIRDLSAALRALTEKK